MSNFLDKTGLSYFWGKVKALLATHTSNKNNPHEVTAEQIGALAVNPNMTLAEKSSPSSPITGPGWYRVYKFPTISQMLVFIDNSYNNGGSSDLCLLVSDAEFNRRITVLSHSGYNSTRIYQKARITRGTDVHSNDYYLDIYYGPGWVNLPVARCLIATGLNNRAISSMNWQAVDEEPAGEEILLTLELNYTSSGAVLTEYDGVKTNSEALLKRLRFSTTMTDGGVLVGATYANALDGGMGTIRGTRSLALFAGCNYTDGAMESQLGERCFYALHDSDGYKVFPVALQLDSTEGRLLFYQSQNGYTNYPANEKIPMISYEILHSGNGARKPVSIPVSLLASAWSSNVQTVTVSGVLADETAQLIQPVPALASQEAYYAAGIRCTAQAANRLTFTCQEVPTANLSVYVVIQELAA